jgi:hypothetical protein
MPIVASDIKFRLSGGASNTDPNAALGGAMSTAGGGLITTDVLNNVWDNVSGAEASAGDIEYRAIFIENGHGSITLTGAKVWVSSNTTSADDEVDIALADEGIASTIETIAKRSNILTSNFIRFRSYTRRLGRRRRTRTMVKKNSKQFSSSS